MSLKKIHGLLSKAIGMGGDALPATNPSAQDSYESTRRPQGSPLGRRRYEDEEDLEQDLDEDFNEFARMRQQGEDDEGDEMTPEEEGDTRSAGHLDEDDLAKAEEANMEDEPEGDELMRRRRMQAQQRPGGGTAGAPNPGMKQGMMHNGRHVAKAQGDTEMDAGPILLDLADALRQTSAELAAIRTQNATIAKALMVHAELTDTIAKSVSGVERSSAQRVESLAAKLDNTARLPRSRSQQAPPRQQRTQVDFGTIISKAVSATDLFTLRDCQDLEAIQNRGGGAADLSSRFSANQLAALGLQAQNAQSN